MCTSTAHHSRWMLPSKTIVVGMNGKVIACGASEIRMVLSREKIVIPLHTVHENPWPSINKGTSLLRVF